MTMTTGARSTSTDDGERVGGVGGGGVGGGGAGGVGAALPAAEALAAWVRRYRQRRRGGQRDWEGWRGGDLGSTIFSWAGL